MSAHESPVCGRACGRFSTLTARTGRFGTVPLLGASPVSGHFEGSGDGEGLAGAPAAAPPPPPSATGPLPGQPASSTPATARDIATRRVDWVLDGCPRRDALMRKSSLGSYVRSIEEGKGT